MKASMEYMASGDLGPLQPDTPQNSMRSLLNALLLKQAPNQVDTSALTKQSTVQCRQSCDAVACPDVQHAQELQLSPLLCVCWSNAEQVMTHVHI